MDEHNTLSASEHSYQEYWITDSPVAYQIQPFTTELDWCDVVYSYDVTDAQGSKIVSFDAETLTFTFENSDDLSLSGPNFKSYSVTVTGTTG